MVEELQRLVYIAKVNPVIKMWIFGSWYKKTNRPDSDLDIAVELEWVKDKMLGVCSNSSSLWSAAAPHFEDAMVSDCPWALDIQQYVSEIETPNIHVYLNEASCLIYEKDIIE